MENLWLSTFPPWISARATLAVLGPVLETQFTTKGWASLPPHLITLRRSPNHYLVRQSVAESYFFVHRLWYLCYSTLVTKLSYLGFMNAFLIREAKLCIRLILTWKPQTKFCKTKKEWWRGEASTGKSRDEFTFLTIFPRCESIFDFQYLLIVTFCVKHCRFGICSFLQYKQSVPFLLYPFTPKSR